MSIADFVCTCDILFGFRLMSYQWLWTYLRGTLCVSVSHTITVDTLCWLGFQNLCLRFSVDTPSLPLIVALDHCQQQILLLSLCFLFYLSVNNISCNHYVWIYLRGFACVICRFTLEICRYLILIDSSCIQLM